MSDHFQCINNIPFKKKRARNHAPFRLSRLPHSQKTMYIEELLVSVLLGIINPTRL